MVIKNQLKHFFQRYTPFSNVWIACSGGVDSLVLLHACHQLVQENIKLNLHVIHINHGLSLHAEAWQTHVEKICRTWQIPFHAEKIKIERASGESLEDQARQARYAVFKSYIKENDLLLTAHHQDDQAETLFLQLLRGAGVLGLAAIHEIMPFSIARLGRPLLTISRQDILTYAKQNNLQWVEDESNQNENFSRNFLRNTIFPQLENRWLQAKIKFAQSANYLQEANELLNELAASDLEKINESDKKILPITYLKTLTPARLNNLLRYWIKQNGFALPSQKVLAAIVDEVIHARVDAEPLVKWEQAEIRRYQDKLYLLEPLAEFDSSISLAWDIAKPLTLPGNLGVLHAESSMQGVKIEASDQVEIRFRQGGEACYLPHRAGKHTLKKLFQEWQIPPWLRDRIPLLYINNQLAAVVGYAVAKAYFSNSLTVFAFCLRKS